MFPVPLELFRGHTSYPDHKPRASSHDQGKCDRDKEYDDKRRREGRGTEETRFEDLDISIPDPDKFHPEKILAIPPTVFGDEEKLRHDIEQIDFSIHAPIIDHHVRGSLDTYDDNARAPVSGKRYNYGGRQDSDSDPPSPIPISTSISVLRSPLHHRHHRQHAPPPPTQTASTSGVDVYGSQEKRGRDKDYDDRKTREGRGTEELANISRMTPSPFDR